MASAEELPSSEVQPEDSQAHARDDTNASTAASVAQEDATQKKQIADRIKVKTDLLRQLKMVKVYRNRAETRDLDDVNTKWLEVCQKALEDFYDKIKDETGQDGGPQVASLGEFIEKLNIDHTLVKFDKSSETFLK